MFQLKPHSSPWFTPTAIAHHNHYFHEYHWIATSKNKKLFGDSHNHCKRVLKDARSNYAETTRCYVASQFIESHDYWRICNSILNRGKFTIPPLFNDPEVLTTKLTFLLAIFHAVPPLMFPNSFLIFHLVLNREQKMDSRKNQDLNASKATGPTEFQPLSLRCVLQSFLSCSCKAIQ